MKTGDSLRGGGVYIDKPNLTEVGKALGAIVTPSTEIVDYSWYGKGSSFIEATLKRGRDLKTAHFQLMGTRFIALDW